ncbi:LAQU0S03e02960g1_1 [Lachancea quebecensis]|uniref:LAQU0S03e02960g1_1 n=1 Tax=Lachancea quebecensis TaxID=1654605 RepID=A0A0P1KNW0_9SACH|nr:LAQU0S03e02960g1_1 [Lachancea quebecensis]
MSNEDECKAIKQFLIELKPQQVINSKITSEQLCLCFISVVTALRNENAINDSERLVLTDSISIWFLRSRQLLELGQDQEGHCHFLQKLQTDILTIENCTFLFHYVIDYWNEGGAALANSLNDLFTKLLQLMKLVHSEAVFQKTLDGWLSQVLKIPASMRVLYYLLDVFATETSMHKVLQSKPDFVADSLSLMWTESLATPIGKCVTSILLNVYEKRYHECKRREDLDEWFLLWEGPTLRYFQDSRISKRIEICILIPIFKSLSNDIFGQFVSRNFDSEAPELIPLLKIGQELSIEEEPFDDDKLVSLKFIEQLLQQDAYKLSAFELLTFSAKKSKVVAPYIYGVIKRNIHVFFVDIEVKTRNAFHSVLKHFIDRVRDSSYSLNRDYASLHAKDKFPDEQAQKLRQIDDATNFVQWLIGFLKSQLSPGSQYQRKILSTKVFKTLASSSIDPSIRKPYLDPRLRTPFPFSCNLSEDETLQRLLIDNLTDNYNDVRENCLQLLTMFAYSKPSTGTANFDAVFEKSWELLKSYKNCDGGAKLIEFLIETSGDKSVLVDALLKELQKKIDMSRASFKEAIKTPVSGYLLALNYILHKPDLIFETGILETTIDKCIVLINSNWKIVEFALCDDPFEQNTPSQHDICEVSDPLVISYAFRSIKESAGLLAALVRLPALTSKQLIACGELMLAQMSTIRHSGAFQSLIPSFVACCRRSNADVPQQLEIWLEEILNRLETKTQFITRRSGGLPHIVTSILGAEDNKNRPLLKKTFDKLFLIASLPVSEHEEQVDLPQVNAFNCIKALFVESSLSVACSPYVYPSLVLCLQSFTSPLWAIRNCSYMLFSALQNRLFGKAGKSVSARLFFSRFTGIREILLDQFKSSVKNSFGYEGSTESPSLSSGMDSQIVSIFLVMTILSRLKQTPGFEGLKEFESLVVTCLGSHNWTLRQLAARTLPSMSDNVIGLAKSLLEKLTLTSINQNTTHGCILAVSELTKTAMENSSSLGLPNELSLLVGGGIPRAIISNSCFVTANAYVGLVELVYSSGSMPKTCVSPWLSKLGEHFVKLNIDYSVDGTRQLFLRSLMLFLLRHENECNLQDVLLLGLYSPYFKVQIAAAQYICSNYKAVHVNNDVIANRLLEILFEDDTWDYVKLSVLRSLVVLEKEVDTSALMKLVTSARNDELRAVALEYLGFFVEKNNSQYEYYVKHFSRDQSPFELRKSSLKSLINFSKRNSEIRTSFLISRFLYDDDQELRMLSASYINQYVLGLSGVRKLTTSAVTANLFYETMKMSPHLPDDFDAIILEALQRDIGIIAFEKYVGVNQEDLFEVEPENQFRNTIEEASRYIEVLKHFFKNSSSVRAYISMIVDELVAQMSGVRVSDAPLCWGSDFRIFTQIVLVRKLAIEFDVKKLRKLDDLLTSLNCNPLIFEITSLV